ncbi:hypothetical protein TNCT_43461 [Trichonephila clavata]|uniref:Uncharacterized protein n=1 Tax=Trichonephila clavata TaxID=2740835 RepID=A0A8X6JFW8_TRICU|nr:hypothetical protein TNCT_43461 [Trichonephila clavata]
MTTFLSFKDSDSQAIFQRDEKFIDSHRVQTLQWSGSLCELSSIEYVLFLHSFFHWRELHIFLIGEQQPVYVGENNLNLQGGRERLSPSNPIGIFKLMINSTKIRWSLPIQFVKKPRFLPSWSTICGIRNCTEIDSSSLAPKRQDRQC